MTKKLRKIVLLLLLVFLIPISYVASGCGKKVSSVQLISKDSTYDIGETLNLNNFTIKVTYDDKSTEDVVVTNEMLSQNLPSLTAEGNFEIKVKYDKKEYTVSITVVDPNKVLSISAKDYDSTYETFDTFVANGKLVLSHKNGTTSDIEIATDMIEELPNMETAGTKTININYLNLNCSYDITVSERQEVSYTFNDVTKNYYNTAKREDLDLVGGKIVITYSNNTTKTIDLTNDMIDECPELNQLGEKTLKLKIGNFEYDLKINITKDPEVIKYEKLVESMKDLIKNGLSNQTSIKASVDIDLYTRVLGNEKTIDKNYFANVKFDAIDDAYLATLVESAIKGWLEENSSNINFEDIVGSLGNFNLDVNELEVLTSMLDKMVASTNNFDFYTYINNTPYLLEIKNGFIEAAASILNLCTFDFDRFVYDEESQKYIDIATENYTKLLSIVEETLYKPLFTNDFNALTFLSEYKKFALEYATTNQELSTAIINIIDSITENGISKNSISKFIFASKDLVALKYKDSNEIESTKIIVETCAEAFKTLEDYFFQDKNSEDFITIKETIINLTDVFASMVDKFFDKEMTIPTVILEINDLLCNVALCLEDERYITEIIVGSYFNTMELYLNNEITYLDTKINARKFQISSYKDHIEDITKHYPEWKEYPNLVNEINYMQYLIEEYNFEMIKDESNLAKYRVICETIMQIKNIAVDYTHKVCFGEEFVYTDIFVDLMNATGNEKIVEQLNEFSLAYNEENGLTYLVTFMTDYALNFVDPILINTFGKNNGSILHNVIRQIAMRIDEDSISTNDIGTDIALIASHWAYIGLTLPENTIFNTTLNYYFNLAIGQNLLNEKIEKVIAGITTAQINELIVSMLKKDVTYETLIDYITTNPALLANLLYCEFSNYYVESENKDGIVYDFIFDTYLKYVESYNIETPKIINDLMSDRTNLITNLINLYGSDKIIESVLGLPNDSSMKYVNLYYHDFHEILDSINDLFNNIVYNNETEINNSIKKIYDNIISLSYSATYVEYYNSIVLPYTELYHNITQACIKDNCSISYVAKAVVNEFVTTIQPMVVGLITTNIAKVNPLTNQDMLANNLSDLILDTCKYYLTNELEEMPDYKNYIVNIAINLGINEKNPYYPVLEIYANSDMLLPQNEEIKQLIDIALTQNKDMIVGVATMGLSKINPNLDTENAMTLLGNFVDDIKRYYTIGGEEINYNYYVTEICNLINFNEENPYYPVLTTLLSLANPETTNTPIDVAKVFANVTVSQYKETVAMLAVMEMTKINPNLDPESAITLITSLINDLADYYINDGDIVDYVEYSTEIVNMLGFTNQNPYYEIFDMIINLTSASTKEDVEEIFNKLGYTFSVENKEIVTSIILKLMHQSNLNFDFDEMYTIIDNLLSDVIEVYLNNADKHIDYVTYIYQIVDELGYKQVAFFIQNYIEEGSPLFLNTYVNFVTKMYYEELANNNYTETQTDKDFKKLLNEISTEIDKYYFATNKEEILLSIKTKSLLLNSILSDVAESHNNYTMYIVSEFANLAIKFYLASELEIPTNILTTELDTIISTIELVSMLGNNTISAYKDLKPSVENILTNYYNETLTTKTLFESLINSKILVNMLTMKIGDMLNLSKTGYTDLTELVTMGIDGYNKNNLDMQKFATKYFAFADNHGGENKGSIYALGIMFLVYTEQEVDYNLLFKNIPLPQGISKVDYNKLIKNIVTRQFIEDAIIINGVDENITYNDDGSLKSQDLSLSIEINFDITFIQFIGTIDFKLGLDFSVMQELLD